jgi:predicted regulator of Ras-like GTPase activity (Roadblock/LC7/MglB family)
MPGLPPLIEEDVVTLDTALDDFLQRSEAASALIIDKGGPILCQRGAVENADTMTIAACAAGAFAATQMIAVNIGEKDFSNIYQQGERYSLLFCNIDEDVLLIVVFKAEIPVGSIKYYAAATVSAVAQQLQKARVRTPQEMVDLVSMNVVDAASIFRQKPQE